MIPAGHRRPLAELGQPGAGTRLNLALALEYRHINAQTAVVLHISVEKAQHRTQAADKGLFWTLTSADMQEAEPPIVGGCDR